jgi:hypothetical protein
MSDFQYTPTGWEDRHYITELLASGEHLDEEDDFLTYTTRMILMKSRWLNYMKSYPDSVQYQQRKDMPDCREKFIHLKAEFLSETDFLVKGSSFLLFSALFRIFKNDYGPGRCTEDLDLLMVETTRLFNEQSYIYRDNSYTCVLLAEHDSNFKFRFKTYNNGVRVKVSMPEAFVNEQYFSF